MTTPTDRELLEGAAKAAGLIDAEWQEDQQGINYERTDRKHFRRALWNPLTNDGDALRLAVKLRIPLVIGKNEIFTFDPFSEFIEDDPYAATRRAIVRAAYEIGKERKP